MYKFIVEIRCAECRRKCGYVRHNFAFMKDAEYIINMRNADDNPLAEFLCEKCLKAQQSTVDAIPVKHGYWTNARTMEHDGEWYCSVCGYEPTVFENTLYCSNCGAQMAGEKVNSDV